eukprot:gene10553-7326_t
MSASTPITAFLFVLFVCLFVCYYYYLCFVLSLLICFPQCRRKQDRNQRRKRKGNIYKGMQAAEETNIEPNISDGRAYRDTLGTPGIRENNNYI